MAKVAVNIKKANVKECTGKVFSDVTSSLGDLCGYVEAAAEAGLVTKTYTKFRPLDLVTRAEMLKMLLSAKGIAAITEDQGFKDLGTDASLNGFINAAAAAGIINKGIAFNPNNNATRGEAFKVAANAAGLTTTSSAEGTGGDLNLGDLFGDITGTGTTTTTTGTVSTGTTTVVTAGDLNVGLNPASPANNTQIPKTGIMRFAVVDFSAGGSDISLNSVEIKKAGLATIPSGTKVWFEKNGTRVSGKTSFTSENNAVISFAPAYVVRAGSTESLDLYVEITTDAGAGNDMQFASAAVTSSAKNTTGSFVTPVLRTSSYAVATATFASTYAGQTYNAGSDALELAKFTIANTDGNPDTRDLKLQSMALYQSGSADLTSLSDITLERNGVVVSSAAMVSGKTLTITVSDIIKDGASAIYTLKAKIVNVDQVTDTYQFYLKNTSDVSLTETDTAFRATITSAAPVVAGFYSVSGGDVKFERDTSVSLSQTVAPGTSDVVLMQGTITAKSAVNLEDVNIGYTTTGTGGSFMMNTVYLQIGSSTFTATPAATLTGTLQFLGSATVNGTATVKMYTKLRDSATGTIKIDTLKIDKFGTKEYVSNQNTVNSAIGSIDGINITIGASTLNVTRTDGLGTTNLSSGSKGVTVLGARFSSTQGNPIALSNFSVTTAGTANSYTAGNTSLTLYVNGVAKSTKNLISTGVTFDGFNSTVSTTANVDIVVKADFSDITNTGSFSIASIGYDAVDNLTSVTINPKPTLAGATFVIASPVGALAATTGDTLVNRTLLLAGSSTQKITSFKVTASNDNIKIKKLVVTGAGLNALSNIRITDSVGTVLGSASNLTDTGAEFVNLDNAAGSAIAIDKSATYYVVADANSATNASNVQANVVVAGSKIIGSNGGEVVMTGSDVVGAAHDVAENTFKVTLGTPTNKAIATDAMEFTVNAFGKNNVTLASADFNNILSQYDTASAVLTVIRKSDNAVVGTASATGAAAEVSTFTVVGSTTNTGTVTVTVNGASYTTATVASGATAATVATALAAAITAGTVTASGAVVTVTAATTGTQTDATVGAVTAPGITVTPAVTTQGAANTPAYTGHITFNAGTSVDANTSATYIVKIVGALVNNTAPDWSVSLTNLTTSTGLQAVSYPKNTDTFPLTTVK
ncbi:MAG: S-layer homology domain-containing protein [Candidatus Gracilibacteria bacterium]|nr:S-layer homology domain-containing protein [Candidatus Gracilibacteria bacterium]